MKSILNDNLWQRLILIFCLLWGFAHGALHAQTCTQNVPCVQVPITNPNLLPGPTVLWTCVGSGCTQTALNAVIAQQTMTNLCPAVSSVWHCLQFSQTKNPQNYNDLEAWGSLVTYASQGTAQGGVAAVSPLVTFQVPLAPAQQTSIGGVLPVVTSGSTGPQ